MLVVWESREIWEVRRMIVTEHEAPIGTLVMIGIHITLNTALDIDEFS
jgi:hypothetical protein